MTKIHHGYRITQGATLRAGASAVIFNTDRSKVLLTRRTDNRLWCIPGGAMESGETVVEACLREVWEETGLRVEIVRLAGVYSNRDRLVEYIDGNRVQFIVLNFEAKITGGSLTLSNETTDAGFFPFEEIETLELLGNHQERIFDALLGLPEPILK